MDIIIFGGQSNMQGQCERLTSTDTVSNAFEYRFLEDEIIPLRNPVGEVIKNDHTKGKPYQSGIDKLSVWLANHVTGASCKGNTNLVPEFCRVYTEITGNKVLAVHIAKGSTVIAEWTPGSRGYDILFKKATAALNKIREKENIERIFFVWLQGESDAVEGNSKDYYKQKIVELNEALKKDIGIEKFGVIRVGRFTKDERDFEIISAQDEVCDENEDFIKLTDIATTLNEQPEYMNPNVKGHYSALGLEKLGQEAGKAFAELKLSL